uniref:Uncharacterized protein n=1 Tax=Anopheles christyi TaxID=43041 RepID=A0A182KI94_9DIPT
MCSSVLAEFRTPIPVLTVHPHTHTHTHGYVNHLLLGGGLQVGDEIATLLRLLQTGEHHLRAGDVLLGVFQILEQRVLVPGDALGLVGVGVAEASSLASLATEQTVQVRADLVLATGLDGVALGAPLNEQLLALLNITSWDTHCC